jgi:hypothetical protein
VITEQGEQAHPLRHPEVVQHVRAQDDVNGLVEGDDGADGAIDGDDVVAAQQDVSGGRKREDEQRLRPDAGCRFGDGLLLGARARHRFMMARATRGQKA